MDFDGLSAFRRVAGDLHESGIGLLQFELGDLQRELCRAELVVQHVHPVGGGVVILDGDGALSFQLFGPDQFLAGEVQLRCGALHHLAVLHPRGFGGVNRRFGLRLGAGIQKARRRGLNDSQQRLSRHNPVARAHRNPAHVSRNRRGDDVAVADARLPLLQHGDRERPARDAAGLDFDRLGQEAGDNEGGHGEAERDEQNFSPEAFPFGGLSFGGWCFHYSLALRTPRRSRFRMRRLTI